MLVRDFRGLLDMQLRFLENSCMLFDAGHHEEAIRLATSIRVIFHDTRNSVSLLKHLQASENNMLATSAKYKEHENCPHSLVVIRIIPGQEVRSIPLLDHAESKRLVPKVDWWNKEVVFYIGDMDVTRRMLVLSAADKDGGAHVDAELNAEYEEVIKGLGMKFTWHGVDQQTGRPTGDSQEYEVKYMHLSGLRQIAYEVLNSPDMLRLAGRMA